MSDLARVETARRGALHVVRLFGEVDLSNAGDVGEAIEAAVPNEAFDVALELSATTYLDSAGVSLVVRLAQRLEARRQRLSVVVPAGSPVRAVLEITGLPDVIAMQTELDGLP